jgi:hypothetical protein
MGVYVSTWLCTMCVPLSQFCRDLHDQILQNYLETGVKNKINQQQTLFAVHSSGFLIQVDILIREVTVLGEMRNAERSGLTFVATIKPVVFDSSLFAKASVDVDTSIKTRPSIASKKVEVKAEFLFMDSSLKIFAATAGAAAFLGFAAADLNSVHLNTWIPDVDQHKIHMSSPSGAVITVRDLAVNVKRVDVSTDNILIQLDVPNAAMQFSSSAVPLATPGGGVIEAAGSSSSMAVRLNVMSPLGARASDAVLVSPTLATPIVAKFGKSSTASANTSLTVLSPPVLPRVASVSEPFGASEKDRTLLFSPAYKGKVPYFSAINIAPITPSPKTQGTCIAPSPKHRSVIGSQDLARSSPSMAFVFDSLSAPAGELKRVSGLIPNNRKGGSSIGNNSVLASMLEHATDPQSDGAVDVPLLEAKDDDAAAAESHDQLRSAQVDPSIKGSQHSSAGSRSSTANLHARLHLIKSIRESVGLSAILLRLQRFLASVALMVVVLALAKFLVVGSLSSAFERSLTDTFTAARIQYLAGRVALTAHALSLTASSNGGFFPTTAIPDWRESLVADAAELEAKTNFLFLDRRTSMPAATLSLYTTSAAIRTQSIQASLGSFEYVDEPTSVWNAIKQYIKSVRAVVVLESETLLTTQTDMFYVIVNGWGSLFTALKASASDYAQCGVAMVSEMSAWAVSLTCVGVVVLFLVSMIIVKPTLWSVEDEKQEILLLFTDIPMPILQAFEVRCKNRLQTIQDLAAGTEKDDLADDDGGLDAGMDEAGGASADEVDDVFQDDRERVTDEDAFANAIRKVGKATSKEEQRRERRRQASEDRSSGFSSRHINLLKVSSLGVLTLIYMVVTYAIEFGNVAALLQSAPSQINAAMARQTFSVQSLYGLRRLATQNYTLNVFTDKPWPLVSSQQVEALIGGIYDRELALTYGSETNNLLPPNTLQSAIAFRTACVPGKSPSDCGTFLNQLLAQGLHEVYLSTIETSRDALALIQDSLAFNASLPSWSLLNASFHSAPMTQLNRARPYQVAANDLSSTLYTTEATDVLVNLYTIRLVALLVFVVAVALLYVLYFVPLVWALNAEQKRTLSLLLLIPFVTYVFMLFPRQSIVFVLRMTYAGRADVWLCLHHMFWRNLEQNGTDAADARVFGEAGERRIQLKNAGFNFFSRFSVGQSTTLREFSSYSDVLFVSS